MEKEKNTWEMPTDFENDELNFWYRKPRYIGCEMGDCTSRLSICDRFVVAQLHVPEL